MQIYLVDCSGYIFRAFHAVQNLKTKDGFPTNALFGFIRMMLKLLKAAGNSPVVAVFDAGRDTFRTALYSEYKANRLSPPPELIEQFPYFRSITKAFGLCSLELAGFEADDIIGTLAERLAPDAEVVVVSGDKDLLQLIGPNVSMWDTMYDKRYGPSEVVGKFGVGPEKVIDILSLMGDDSDNIPGVNGVGPKTASQLINKYGNISSILEKIEEIRIDKSIRQSQNIAAQIELMSAQIRLNLDLVKIHTKVPLTIEGQEVQKLDAPNLVAYLGRKDRDGEVLRGLLEKFEFFSLIKELDLLPASANILESKREVKIIWEKDAQSFFSLLRAQPVFGLDFETSSLDPLAAEIIGASFSWKEGEAYYLPIGHVGELPFSQIPKEILLKELTQVMREGKKCIVGQNLKYDLSILSAQGVKEICPLFDTMIAAHLLNPDRGAYDLGRLAQDYLGEEVQDFEDVLGGQETFATVPLEQASKYAGQDAEVTFRLYLLLKPLLEKEELSEAFNEIEIPLIPLLVAMEERGVNLDCGLLEGLSTELTKDLDGLTEKIKSLAGEDFNLNSPKQLAEILFNKLALPVKGIKKTKTGFSTDSSSLEKLLAHHPLPKFLLEYRALFKLKSTYVDVLPLCCNKRTGRLHTRFHQTGTATGRLSSSDPNLQNIPITTARGREIRKAFIAGPGKKLLSADYSQIELRLLAHVSGDKALIRAFQEGADIHAQTAREVLGLSADTNLTPEMRRLGKTINFGVMYGMGPQRLARDLEIPYSEADSYIKNYFERFSGVRDYIDSLVEVVKVQGDVRTIFGRKRSISGLDVEGRDQGFALRAATNAPIQGSAADILKRAMVEVWRAFESENLPAAILLQIHDELLIETEDEAASVVMSRVKEIMENVVQLKVPLKVEVGIGNSWEEAHH